MRMTLLLITATAAGALTALTACARTPEPPASTASTVAAPMMQAASASPPRDVPQTPQAASASTAAGPNKMVVHKSASCGCCGLWVDHMREAGFAVEVREADDIGPVKQRVGIPYGKGSCHTAEIGGYFIEGHVPAADVKRLLAEQPNAKGLVLPGMPMGSPGMESPDGSAQAYTVELVGPDGATTAFAEHAARP